MKAYFTIGLPASGKSTWAFEKAKYNDCIVIERDIIREEIVYVDTWPDVSYSRKSENLVTKLCYEAVKSAFNSGKDVILSDTNLNKNNLDNYVRKVQDIGYDEIEFVEFTDVSLKEILKRNRIRYNSVPEFVIHRMAKSRPDLFKWAKAEYSLVDRPYDNPIDLPKCVIVDVDGTIANHRNNDRSLYDMTRVGEDAPNVDVMDMIASFVSTKALLGDDIKVIIVTARSDEDGGYENTKDWLDEHFQFHDEILIRKAGDYRKDCLVKEEMFNTHIRDKYHVSAVFDDREAVKDMWVNMGLRVYQCYTPHFPDNDF